MTTDGGGVAALEPERPASDLGGPAIEARNLAVGYRGEVVVADIDLTMARGTSLALVGTNGSGKSTLVRTIVGLTPPIAGSLLVLGKPPGRSAGGVGYLAQFHPSGDVLPIRAIDVVRMGRYASLGLLGRFRAEDDELVAWAMEQMGVAGLRSEPVRSLSGGQRQRVYLAQVLAHRADLIVLDEPTAGLDVGGQERYLAAFAAEVARGAALVTATHDIGEAIEHDQVLLLARRVVALGPGRDVLTPDQLQETFGIVIHDEHEEHVGRFTVAERAHGAPQVIEGRPPEPPTNGTLA